MNHKNRLQFSRQIDGIPSALIATNDKHNKQKIITKKIFINSSMNVPAAPTQTKI